MDGFGRTLADLEREHILWTLTECGGNRTQTAKVLGISIRCLRMKLHQFSVSTAGSGDLGRIQPLENLPTIASQKEHGRKDLRSRMSENKAACLRALLGETEAADLFAPTIRQRIGETIASTIDQPIHREVA